VTKRNWERIIPASWFDIPERLRSVSLLRAVTCLVFACCALALPSGGSGKKRQSSIASRSPQAVGAAGFLALAQHQLDVANFTVAADYAATAASKAPTLVDYAHYIRAQAEYALKNYSEVAKSATHVFNQVPTSPFIGPAAALAVRADLDGDSPKDALDLVKKYYDVIPQPEADLLLARCFAATGDLLEGAQH
jgi:hypothetical protein